MSVCQSFFAVFLYSLLNSDVGIFSQFISACYLIIAWLLDSYFIIVIGRQNAYLSEIDV